MVKIQVDLDSKEDEIITVHKIRKKMKDKRTALKDIIKSHKEAR